MLLALDGLFFGLFDPTKITSIGLFFGFTLMSVSFYVLVSAATRLATWYGLPIGRHRRRLTISITAVGCGIFALQSIGELTGKDLLVLIPLAVLVYGYFSYGRGTVRTTS